MFSWFLLSDLVQAQTKPSPHFAQFTAGANAILPSRIGYDTLGLGGFIEGEYAILKHVWLGADIAFFDGLNSCNQSGSDGCSSNHKFAIHAQARYVILTNGIGLDAIANLGLIKSYGFYPHFRLLGQGGWRSKTGHYAFMVGGVHLLRDQNFKANILAGINLHFVLWTLPANDMQTFGLFLHSDILFEEIFPMGVEIGLRYQF